MTARHRRLCASTVALLLIVIEAWYPFRVELPLRIVNTASRLADGSWVLDALSKVAGQPPEAARSVLDGRSYGLAVEAVLGAAEQSGPARLFSTGGDPFDPALTIGIERGDVVLRVPCAAGPHEDDVEWKVPFSGPQVVVTVAFPAASSVDGPTVAVNGGDSVRLPPRCPRGVASPTDAVLTLGNVQSGHRPFIGQIRRLEVSDGQGVVDLLRQTSWKAPAVYWRWPERLYEPSDEGRSAWASASWHLASFAVLGYLVGPVTASVAAGRTMTAGLALALNGGKTFMAYRHPAIIDLVLDIMGAFAGLGAWKRRSARAMAMQR